jgi:hypothetical protein
MCTGRSGQSARAHRGKRDTPPTPPNHRLSPHLRLAFVPRGNLLQKLQQVIGAKIRRGGGDVIAVAGQHHHTLIGNLLGIGLNRHDRLQAALLRRHDQRRAGNTRKILLELHVDARR